MLSPKTHKRAYVALFLAGLACVFAFGVYSGMRSSEPPPNQQAINAGHQSAEGAPVEVTQAERADDRIARYTLWLAIFTCALVVISAVQIAFLTSADKTARKAADTAMLQAKASIGVELPKLMLFHLDFKLSDATRFLDKMQYPIIEISVKNFGRTPAFITFQATEIAWRGLAPKPDYGRTGHNPPPETIVEQRDTYGLGDLRAADLCTEVEVREILANRRFLWVFGCVAYRDFLGDRHALRFCRRLFIRQSGGHVWTEGDSPSAYTDSY
jgi:hypothetical protein